MSLHTHTDTQSWCNFLLGPGKHVFSIWTLLDTHNPHKWKKVVTWRPWSEEDFFDLLDFSGWPVFFYGLDFSGRPVSKNKKILLSNSLPEILPRSPPLHEFDRLNSKITNFAILSHTNEYVLELILPNVTTSRARFVDYERNPVSHTFVLD